MAGNSAKKHTSAPASSNPVPKAVRCAVYTRKSTDEGLQQEFNSLDAQREAAEAFITSQKHEGWELISDHFDDGGYTGGNMDRPALSRLISAIEAKQVDCVVVYKVDRLSRSLLDFAKMMELFDRHGVSFVSVTQQFNTTSSLGRLTLNILLSFAQFEREIISERTRDKMSAARKKGKWVGGHPVLGYDIEKGGGRLVMNPDEADRVRAIFGLYLEHEGLVPVLGELDASGWASKRWTTEEGKVRGGKRFTKASLHGLLTNAVYTGMVNHKGTLYPGEHEGIVDRRTWDRVQNVLRRNGRGNGGGSKNKYGALLRGILSCGSCGSAMIHTYTMRLTKRYRYYVCYKAQQRGWAHCETKSVSAQGIESAVLESIRRLGSDPVLAQSVFEQAKEQHERRHHGLDRERSSAARAVQRIHRDLARAVADQKLTAASRADLLVRLESELDTAEQRVAEIGTELAALDQESIDPAEVRKALEQFDGVWESLTTREQERLIRLLVAGVTYDGRTGKAGVAFKCGGARSLCRANHD
jgi:site-specific DNA recombinase